MVVADRPTQRKTFSLSISFQQYFILFLILASFSLPSFHASVHPLFDLHLYDLNCILALEKGSESWWLWVAMAGHEAPEGSYELTIAIAPIRIIGEKWAFHVSELSMNVFALPENTGFSNRKQSGFSTNADTFNKSLIAGQYKVDQLTRSSFIFLIVFL